MLDVNYREMINTLKPQISVPQPRHALKYPHTCMVGLQDISFQHRYRDVHIRNSHIAGCVMFSRPILFVICIYTDCFLCSHRQTEINQYRLLSSTLSSVSPVTWWWDMKDTLPMLADLAPRYLCASIIHTRRAYIFHCG